MQPGIQNQVATSSFFDGIGPVRSFFAPGRINIIGEHLDYNGGSVFPGAISLGITGYIQYRDDMLLRLTSEQEQQAITIDLNSSAALSYDADRGWANYPVGALVYLNNNGMVIQRGMNIRFSSTLPQGSGLSSSAALEVLTAVMATGEHGQNGIRSGSNSQTHAVHGKRIYRRPVWNHGPVYRGTGTQGSCDTPGFQHAGIYICSREPGRLYIHHNEQ